MAGVAYGPLCALSWPLRAGASNFSHVECEAGCSLMIISTQMKAEDPLHRNSCHYCGVLCVQSST